MCIEINLLESLTKNTELIIMSPVDIGLVLNAAQAGNLRMTISDFLFVV